MNCMIHLFSPVSSAPARSLDIHLAYSRVIIRPALSASMQSMASFKESYRALLIRFPKKKKFHTVDPPDPRLFFPFILLFLLLVLSLTSYILLSYKLDTWEVYDFVVCVCVFTSMSSLSSKDDKYISLPGGSVAISLFLFCKTLGLVCSGLGPQLSVESLGELFYQAQDRVLSYCFLQRVPRGVCQWYSCISPGDCPESPATSQLFPYADLRGTSVTSGKGPVTFCRNSYTVHGNYWLRIISD